MHIPIDIPIGIRIDTCMHTHKYTETYGQFDRQTADASIQAYVFTHVYLYTYDTFACVETRAFKYAHVIMYFACAHMFNQHMFNERVYLLYINSRRKFRSETSDNMDS